MVEKCLYNYINFLSDELGIIIIVETWSLRRQPKTIETL